MLRDAYVAYLYQSVCLDCGLESLRADAQLIPEDCNKSILQALVLQGSIRESEMVELGCLNCPSVETVIHEHYELVTTSTN